MKETTPKEYRPLFYLIFLLLQNSEARALSVPAKLAEGLTKNEIVNIIFLKMALAKTQA